jgi:hypothetical protein
MTKESWMNNKWRPAMAWMYMCVCVFDFVIFPVLWSIVQVAFNGKIDSQWNPLTLMGAGLFHMAMGAVLGVTAWSRGQEKILGTTGTVNYTSEYKQPVGYKFASLKRPAEPTYPEI